MPIAYTDLARAVEQDSAFRRKRRLQPAGGAGDKIFPPTYPGEGRNNPPPRHVFERRMIDGAERWCVLIDSVQSQANRLEEALLNAAREDRIKLPRLAVDFTSAGFNSIGEITTLDAPHRLFDAILRDSLLEGVPLQKTGFYDRLKSATPKDATAILEASPTALLFGVWNSTGEGGGLGAKFPRAIVSEIIGVGVPVEALTDLQSRNRPQNIVEVLVKADHVNTDNRVLLKAENQIGDYEVRTAARRTGSRIDPLGIVKGIEIYEHNDNPDDWTVDPEEARQENNKPVKFGRKDKKKAGKPSVINHGNVRPSVAALGVTCSYAEQTAVISLAGLRRLRFGGSLERDNAARTLIAALGLVALAEQDAQGYALRSRCDLVCEGAGPLEKVAFDGSVEAIMLPRKDAAMLYAEAYTMAREAGFNLIDEPVRLIPQPKLVHIVRESQRRALRDEVAGEDIDGNEQE